MRTKVSRILVEAGEVCTMAAAVGGCPQRINAGL